MKVLIQARRGSFGEGVEVTQVSLKKKSSSSPSSKEKKEKRGKKRGNRPLEGVRLVPSPPPHRSWGEKLRVSLAERRKREEEEDRGERGHIEKRCRGAASGRLSRLRRAAKKIDGGEEKGKEGREGKRIAASEATVSYTFEEVSSASSESEREEEGKVPLKPVDDRGKTAVSNGRGRTVTLCKRRYIAGG